MLGNLPYRYSDYWGVTSAEHLINGPVSNPGHVSRSIEPFVTTRRTRVNGSSASRPGTPNAPGEP